jgi:hypothetical protein
MLAQLLVPVAAAQMHAQATDPSGHILIPPPAPMFRHLAVIHCNTTIVRFVKSPSPVRSSPT